MCGFFWYVAYKKYHATCMVFFGAPGTTRTYDPQIRNLMLYPTELRVHKMYPSSLITSSFPRRSLVVPMKYASLRVLKLLVLSELNTFCSHSIPGNLLKTFKNTHILYTRRSTSVKLSPSRSRFSKANGRSVFRTSFGFNSSRPMESIG